MAINKTSNDYADVISQELYEKTPKAVFAAIAISLATSGGERLDEAADVLIEEWLILHQNGIVPQKPPKRSNA